MVMRCNEIQKFTLVKLTLQRFFNGENPLTRLKNALVLVKLPSVNVIR